MKTLSRLFLLLAMFSAATLAADVPKVTQAQLQSLTSAPNAPEFVILDVRTAEEFSEGHIENAINISHDQVEANLAKLVKYKDTMIIVHCRSGRRASHAEEILMNNGFGKVKHLDGDMKGWIAAGLPTTK